MTPILALALTSGCSSPESVCFLPTESSYRDARTGETVRIEWPGHGVARLTYGGLGVKASDTRPNDGDNSTIEVEYSAGLLNYGNLVSIPVQGRSGKWSTGSLDCASMTIPNNNRDIIISCENKINNFRMKAIYSLEDGVKEWSGLERGSDNGFSLRLVGGVGFGTTMNCDIHK